MNTIVWLLQAVAAVTYLYSGICKSTLSEQALVARGQTGVEGLPITLTRFIGIMEILGAMGLILPWWLQIFPLLTPIAAMCFVIVMILAARIHLKRHEYGSVAINATLFVMCGVIAYWRL